MIIRLNLGIFEMENEKKKKFFEVLCDYPPILNIFVPHIGHVPFFAFLPFFIVTSSGSFISLFSLHFTQYASVIVITLSESIGISCI